MAFDWKSVAGKVFPWLATALGGPPAGLAVDAICHAVGLESTPENAAKVMEQAAAGKLSGDQFLALKKAEQDFMLRAQELGYKQVSDMEKIAADDRDSARKREIAVRDHTPAIGFYFTSIGFFGLLAVLIFHAAPEGSRDLLNIMLGALSLAWGNEIKYFYGGSTNDAKTSEMLYKSTPPEQK